MEINILLYIVICYIFGFFISLFLLHKFAHKLGWNHYDPPHDDYYDDYESNAHAYVAFSLAWPLFWVFNLLLCIYRLIIKFSEHIDNYLKEKHG